MFIITCFNPNKKLEIDKTEETILCPKSINSVGTNIGTNIIIENKIEVINAGYILLNLEIKK